MRDPLFSPLSLVCRSPALRLISIYSVPMLIFSEGPPDLSVSFDGAICNRQGTLHCVALGVPIFPLVILKAKVN